MEKESGVVSLVITDFLGGMQVVECGVGSRPKGRLSSGTDRGVGRYSISSVP